jgi:methionyl-tRNA synthetase
MEANRYLEFREPWKAAKDPDLAERVRTTLFTCCEVLRIVSLLLYPVIPQKSKEIFERLGLEGGMENLRLPEDAAWGRRLVGLPTIKGNPLFPRVEMPDHDA